MLPDIDRDRLAAFLRRQHKYDTAWEVHRRTGIPADTVKNWLSLRAAPSIRNFMRLAAAYGPELIAETWPAAPAWLAAAVRDERARRLGAEIAARQAELDAIAAEIHDMRG